MTQASGGGPVGGGSPGIGAGGGGGGALGTMKEKPELEKIVEKIVAPEPEPPKIPVAYAKYAFKPRAKLTIARVGRTKIPKGSRIAGREAPPEVNLDKLLATDAERISIAWMSEMEIPFDFETILLGGRMALNNAEVPFFLSEKLLASNYQALRIFEQMNGKLLLERDLLYNSGYEVIDLSGMALLNDVDAIMREVLEFL